MPTNDFIGFASSGSANIMSQADFAAAAEQTDGVQPGPASSSLANKVWRQGANMAAAIGEIMIAQNVNALDDGDIATLSTNLKQALSSFLAATQSGTWTPELYGDTTEGVLTYSGRQGHYRKIGNVCFLAFRIDVSGYTTLPAGKVRVKGIPYAADNNSGAYNFGSVIASGSGSYQKLRAGVVRDSFIGIRSVDANNFQILDDATWGANSSDTGGVKIFPSNGTIFGFATYFTA